MFHLHLVHRSKCINCQRSRRCSGHRPACSLPPDAELTTGAKANRNCSWCHPIRTRHLRCAAQRIIAKPERSRPRVGDSVQPVQAVVPVGADAAVGRRQRCPVRGRIIGVAIGVTGPNMQGTGAKLGHLLRQATVSLRFRAVAEHIFSLSAGPRIRPGQAKRAGRVGGTALVVAVLVAVTLFDGLSGSDSFVLLPGLSAVR